MSASHTLLDILSKQETACEKKNNQLHSPKKRLFLMMRKYLLPGLALCGALCGLIGVYWSQKSTPTPPILFPPAQSPYKYSIAAAGIIEASSQNISIGTPFNEIITKIHVVEGDHVNKGDVLFELDTRTFEATLAAALASLDSAVNTLNDKRKQFSFYKRLADKSAVSEQLYEEARYTYIAAVEAVKVAEANVSVAKSNIERSIIRAPITGQILQVNIHVGEVAPVIPFISAQSTWLTAANGTLILMGATDPLQVRVDIDEDDAWRFKAGARAHAYVRGNRNINFPLTYQRTEPYIIPKTSFTGQTVERVDTRVLQALYLFEKDTAPIYPGQILDIFIESEPIGDTQI